MTADTGFKAIDALRRDLVEDIKDRFEESLANYFSLRHLVEFDRHQDPDRWDEIRDSILNDGYGWTETTALHWRGFPFQLQYRLVEIMENCYDGYDEDGAHAVWRIHNPFLRPDDMLDMFAVLTIRQYGDEWFDAFRSTAAEELSKVQKN
jgi:hypothetical protein